MRRIAAAAAVAALAVLAGTAHGDTFAVVPSASALADVAALAPASVPNAPGSIVLPASFTTPPAVREQRSYVELQALWQRAGAAYGVPWTVLAAIDKVESNFGRNMGPSSAGAIGWMQFMPSTWLRWGMDANGDGVADPWNPDDAIFSAARYLAAAGAAADVAGAVFSYNHADWYVREVLDLAQLYAQGGTIAFTLDRLQIRLDAARKRVVRVNRALDRQLAFVASLARAERPWRARAARATLLSDRLDAERRAGRIELQRRAALAVAAAQTRTLRAAQATLAHVRADAGPAAFAQGAGQLLRAPSFSGGYVFPVGGGPGVVSVSHGHHDYPAADIAAPEGTPVYALASAVVLRAWRYPDPRCGIGLTLQSFDGQVWTYCHLAYEEPGIHPGTQLNAGAPVGLVGATGDASGPHLHLQLQPPTQWPQQESWFQSFAGTAFAWQDAAAPVLQSDPAPTAAVAAPAPVEFSVAPGQTQARQLSAAQPAGPVFAVVTDRPAFIFTR